MVTVYRGAKETSWFISWIYPLRILLGPRPLEAGLPGIARLGPVSRETVCHGHLFCWVSLLATGRSYGGHSSCWGRVFQDIVPLGPVPRGNGLLRTPVLLGLTPCYREELPWTPVLAKGMVCSVWTESTGQLPVIQDSGTCILFWWGFQLRWQRHPYNSKEEWERASTGCHR